MNEQLLATRSLAELEAEIEQGLGVFVKVGQALLAIREGRKYRDQDYPSFEDYMQRRWGWSRDYGYKLMRAAEVADSLPVDQGIHLTERQARELARLPDPEARAEVLAEVGPDASPTDVREAVNRHPSAPTPKPRPIERVPEPAADVPDADAGSQWQCAGCSRWYADDVSECPACQPEFWPDATPPAHLTGPTTPDPRTQARAEQAQSDALLEQAGVLESPAVQRAHLRRVYFDAAKPLRSTLLFLDTDALVAALEPDDRVSVQQLIRDTRQWLDDFERALGRGLRVIDGGKAHG